VACPSRWKKFDRGLLDACDVEGVERDLPDIAGHQLETALGDPARDPGAQPSRGEPAS
jgi:hypothetical protein